MDNTIIGHFGDNRILLLKHILPIKYVRDGKYSEYLSLSYNKRGYEALKTYDHTNINYKQRIALFNNGTISITELNGLDAKNLHTNSKRNDRKTINFSTSYSKNNGNVSYDIYVYLDIPRISYNFSHGVSTNLTLNLNKEVTDLLIRYGQFNLTLENDILQLTNNLNGRILYNLNITDPSIDSVIEEFNSNGFYNLTFELHSNSKIKKIGMTKVYNGRKEGIFYESYINGHIKLSSYRDGALHGYYFNSFTNEQGFYDAGVKVGFWKEGGQLVNYDEELVFFIFPIFPF